MSNKSTPGPWVLAGGDTVIVRSKGGYRIAEVDYDYPGYEAGIDFEEAVANARLIAAAPDLLEEGIQNERFLLQLIDLGVELPEPWDGILIERANRTRAAVAKAKGE